MAPPPDKKEKPSGWNLDPIEGLILLLLLTTFLGTVIPVIQSYFSSGQISFYGFRLSGIVNFFKSNLGLFKAIGFVTAGAAFLGVFILNKKSGAISREEESKLYPNRVRALNSESGVPESQNSYEGLSSENQADSPFVGRWQKIVSLSQSENQSDWRLSIIEADIMLDELLERLHLPGDTMGDKLKAVEKSDFTTIDYAWEAHKVRNMIAHEGNSFPTNQREIRRVISLYEAVFKEFQII